MTTPDPYAILERDGKKVDALTDGALKRAERILGYTLTVRQGSYNAGGVKASAGTHDGGGVVDLLPWDHDAKVKALRTVGFAAWYRPAITGLWSAHIHAVLIGHGRLAPAAADQVQAYLARRNGLKSNGPDVDPGWTNVARYTVEAFRADVLREELKARIGRKRTKRQALRDQIDRLRNRLRGLPR